LRAIDPGSFRTFLAPTRCETLQHAGGAWRHPQRIAMLQALNLLPAFFCNAVAPRCDLFHASNLLRTLPRRRLSATVHDLTAWIVPECHTEAVVNAERDLARNVFRQAAGIIAVSENTKSDAIRLLGLDPDKIQVIYPGVPETYFSVSAEAEARARSLYSLNRPFFLSVGTIEPRKNIETLLKAWHALPADFRVEHELVIAGMPGWKSSETMRRVAQAVREPGGIRYLGYVPEEEMAGLTSAAMALVYPSLYEGFGFPVAQAMAAGCPVITSNISSLPEITAGAALLIDPRDAGQLGASMVLLAGSKTQRERLRAQGITASRRFTWERAAADSLKFFNRVAG
jgi:glycosyltransferase involved in cell wall biosynthesis